MRIERVVRTNYNDLKNGVHATTEYLERFFDNLLFNTNHDLKNRYLYVDYKRDAQRATDSAPKCNDCTLNCTLDELAVLQQMKKNPKITQKALERVVRANYNDLKNGVHVYHKKYLKRSWNS